MSFTNFSVRNAAVAAASLFLTGTLFTATAVEAAQGDNIYRIELAQSVTESVTVTRNIGWRCADTTCVAPAAGSPDRHVCIWIARELGTLTSFQSGNRNFTAEELSACNSRA